MFDTIRRRIADLIRPTTVADYIRTPKGGTTSVPVDPLDSAPVANEPQVGPVSTFPYPGLNSLNPDPGYTPFTTPITINPQQVELNLDQIRSEASVPPWRTVGSLDNYGRETDEMREAYRNYHRTEGTVRAAIQSKIGSVASLDVSVVPHPRKSQLDKDAANFVKWTIDNTPHGWPGLIRRVLEAALVDGFSVSEITLRHIDDDPVHRGKWGLLHVKNKDTDKLRLQVDAYRNVTGVTNLARGAQSYPMSKIILYTHADMYDNPHGISDLRSCYRTCMLINEAYKLWRTALHIFSGPLLIGRYSNAANKRLLEEALEVARQSGYIVLRAGEQGKQDAVEILNMAQATDFQSFERKIMVLRQDIFLAIRGGYLPFLESAQPNATGNTKVNQTVGTDPLEYMLAVSAAKAIRHQLFPQLVYPNYGSECGLPSLSLGGTDWNETSKQMAAALQKKQLGGSVSRIWLDEISGIPPAVSPEDELQIPASLAAARDPNNPALATNPTGQATAI